MSVASNLLSSNTSGIETDTSGWAAGSNTTLSKSTRFYAGAASLGLTATAAGAVTAAISARVAVVAGTEYTAYSYWANAVAASGRTATVRVDWYAAVSGGTALSSVTSAGSTLPNATTWLTPPPILIATAPAGANYASVTVSCSGLAAGATVVTDSVSFGLPNIVSSNLLPYNTSGSEVDASAWTAHSTVSVSRSTTIAYEGWCSLRLTATAVGQVESRQSVRASVTAGTEYVAHAWVQPSDSALEFKIQILWYDASDVGIGSRFTQSWTPSAGGWTRCSVIGVAPPGATTARIALSPVSSATGQAWNVDVIALRPTPVPAGSLIGYNVAGMEVDASGWVALAGCTISRTTEAAWEGAASLRIDEAGTVGMDATVAMAAPAPVVPRQSYQVTPYVRLGTSSVAREFIIRFTWFTASDEVLRFSDSRWTLNPGPGTGWYAPPASAVAPTDAASLQVSFRIVSPEVGQPAYIDNVALAPGGLAVIPDVVPGRYGTSIALQGLTSGGYTYWGLWRVAEDGTLTAVRGATGDMSKVPVVGDVGQVEDFEAPLGVPVRYYLKLWTTLPAYRALTSDSIVIPEPAPTEIVLKDPGLPARQTTAVVAKGGQPTWTRKARQSVNAVRGRSRPIVISDMRTSREGSLTLITETREELEAMWWLLETGNTVLIQWPSIWGEKDVYVAVGDVAEAPFVEYAEYADRSWTVPLTEVDRPIGGATGSAGRTWQTVLTDHPDGMDVLETYSSWLGVLTGVEGT